MTEDELPPLDGSLLLDPWRIRHRLALRGELEPRPPHPPTRSEQMLWECLEHEPPGWVREYATGPYRLDFYCVAARVAVEVDGSSHWGRRGRERDELRDAWHLLQGIRTHRFSADEVEHQLPWVLESIRELVRTRSAEPNPVGPRHGDASAAVTAEPRPEALPVSDLLLRDGRGAPAEGDLLVESAGDLLAADMAEAVAQVLAVAEACRTILPAPRQGRSLLDLLDF